MRHLIFTAFLLLFFSSSYSQVSISIQLNPSLKKSLPSKGRMLLYFARDSTIEPMNSIIPWDPLNSGLRFGQDLKWKGEAIDAAKILVGFPKKSVQDLDTGTYYVQAVYKVDTTSYRLATPPNYYSQPQKVRLTKKKQTIRLQLDRQFGPPEYRDSRFSRFISIRSTLLSNFWKRDVHLHARVDLPPDYDSTGKTQYPVVYRIGGYATDCRNGAFYGPDTTYINQWKQNNAPAMLRVLLDSDGPYGDNYQMNSENNGPYMDALIQELIPAIEKRFHALGTPASRFLTGGSTGGWVSLALQIYNPDFFNGCWSFYADPVDFNFFQLVNLYKDKNAFVNRYGNLNPSVRSVYGEPLLTIKDEIMLENVLGRNNSYVFSGDQWGGWNAVFSPKGKDGKPLAIWDAYTGRIDTAVAQSWSKWDLRLYLEKNWKEIGPKLQGKLHIFMGDMDNFYLNNAMRLFQQFIQNTTDPRSDAEILFGPMQEHGWHPLNRFEVMQKMKQRFDSTAKSF